MFEMHVWSLHNWILPLNWPKAINKIDHINKNKEWMKFDILKLYLYVYKVIGTRSKSYDHHPFVLEFSYCLSAFHDINPWLPNVKLMLSLFFKASRLLPKLGLCYLPLPYTSTPHVFPSFWSVPDNIIGWK